MKAKVVTLSLLALLFGLDSPPDVSAQTTAVLAQLTPEEEVSVSVYRNASPAVVTLSQGRSSGSGSIIRADGLVLTNEHVVRGARQVRVTTADNRRFSGRVLAVDRRNDLALVQIQTRERLPFIPLAGRDGIAVGQQVFAIGSPFGLSGTLTTGILSRVAANGDLQTDASINPGNSGGPLLNSAGQLIGVNKAILSPGGRGNTGIGFATSALTAQNFIARSANSRGFDIDGNIGSTPTRPVLGVTVDSGTLTIRSVQARSAAASAGIRPGDRLIGINGRRIVSLNELRNFLDTQPQSAVLTVRRRGQFSRVRVSF